MILSIETATSTCSVAITSGQKVLAESNYYLDKSHSALLPKIVEELLVNCGIRKAELQAVAVSDGPGSYTGLRIGASTAKGICYALEIPLLIINTLEALALTASQRNVGDGLLCPMIDARRMEVYMAIYDQNLLELAPTSAVVLGDETFKKYSERTVWLFGNGAKKAKELYEQHENISFLEKINFNASAVGILADKALRESKFADLAYYEPNYFKEFKAIKPKPLL